MCKCIRIATDSESKVTLPVITAEYLLLHMGGELWGNLFCSGGCTCLLKTAVCFLFIALTRVFCCDDKGYAVGWY